MIVGVLRVDEFVLLVDQPADDRREALNVERRDVVEAAIRLLRLDDGVEVAAIGDVEDDAAETGHVDLEPAPVEEGRDVPQPHLDDVAEIVAGILGLDDPGGRLEDELPLVLRRHQPFLDEDGDGADRAMAAHRQAAARLDEEERAVGVLAHRLVEDRPRHQIVAARLEHQAGADPVVAGEKILALLAHGGAVERRAAAGDDPDRVAAGVGVDAEESLAHGGCRGLGRGGL